MESHCKLQELKKEELQLRLQVIHLSCLEGILTDTNELVSEISRDSIDALKEYFKDELVKDDWILVIKLKKMFGIP